MPRLKTGDSLMGTMAASRYLNLHRSTLTAWRRRGELVPTAVVETPLGRRYLYSKEALDTFKERIDFDA